jgi:peptide/nickel transport system substrate-binding protein
LSRCTARAAWILSLLPLLLQGPLWAGGAGEPPQARPGGTLAIGAQPPTTLDPHLATSIADIQLLEQVYEHLTYIGASNRPEPDLAASWQSPDGRTWTFTLREGARFSNGKLVTSRDVVASFQRLRDPRLAAPAAALYENILEVKSLDARRVRFLLAQTNPEFASDVGDYHAAVLPAGIADPARERIGSGPFRIASYIPGRLAVLERNPYYNRRDPSGTPLPYLQELRFAFAGELSGQVEALRRGELGFVGGLTTGMVKSLAGLREVKILSVDSNMHWAIRLRSDRGPAADNRVRQALKLATNHQALVDAIRPGLASVGNGFTPVGPAYGRYHLVRPPFMDLARARDLLAQAGHPDGLRIVLHAQDQLDAVSIAAIWKQQLALIGVEVTIQVIPPEQYYGAGDWLEADFGITDWGTRATPVSYFKLAYTTGAPWNETHWSDPDFDELVAKIDRERRESRRVALYHRAQEILIERGPLIVPYFVKAVAGARSDLQGVNLASDWPRTRFGGAWLGR